MGLIRKVLYNVGSWVREKGQVIDHLGSRLQGSHYCQEQHVCRHRTMKNIIDKAPTIDKEIFVAPRASIFGYGSSIWYGRVLQDHVLHGSTAEDEAFVGKGANLLYGATIEKNDMFAARHLGRQNTRTPTGKKQSEDSYDGSFPSHFDWRQKGVVTRVKNQLCYDYCYIFSGIAGIEGVNTIVTNTRHSLSEQQFVDCNRINHGCCPHGRRGRHRGRRGRRRGRSVGGRIHSVFEYVINNGGISLDKDYPFVGPKMPCKKVKVWKELVTIDGYAILPIDEQTLLQAVLQQPVCVGLHISLKDLHDYREGIYRGYRPTNKKDLAKHAMLIVAFGTRNGEDYWTMKNSWGDEWGQAGYIDVWRKSNVIVYASCPIKLR